MIKDVHIKNPTLLICVELFTHTKLRRWLKGATSNAFRKPARICRSSATLTITELEQSKAAVLNSLASQHSRRGYEYAIERFIAWYCAEPRLTFNRSVVVKYRSFLERLSLSAATINLHLSAIRRLADESAESGWLSPEHAIGIRRVKGVSGSDGKWATGSLAIRLKS
jgi:hypothetical protein